VVGMSTDGTGVCATSTNNFGLNAYSANNTALRAFTGSSHPAIEGENTGSGPGVRGEGTSGYGGHFTSTYNDALYVDGTSKFTGQITSTVPTGTAPFSVASTTLNPNLNADMVDGLHAGDFALTVPLCCQSGEGTATTWTDIPMTTLYDQLAKFGHTKARLVATAAAGGSMGYIRLFNVTDGVEVASTGHGASGMYEIDISSAFTVSWDLKVFKLQYRCGGPGSWVRWREASFALLLYK